MGHQMTQDEIYRRAGGRRRYNHQRQFKATYRRVKVAALMRDTDLNQSAIAKQLGVHRSTISRDLARMEKEVRERWRQQAREQELEQFLAEVEGSLEVMESKREQLKQRIADRLSGETDGPVECELCGAVLMEAQE